MMETSLAVRVNRDGLLPIGVHEVILRLTRSGVKRDLRSLTLAGKSDGELPQIYGGSQDGKHQNCSTIAAELLVGTKTSRRNLPLSLDSSCHFAPKIPHGMKASSVLASQHERNAGRTSDPNQPNQKS